MNSKAKIIKFTEILIKIVIVLLGIWILYKKIFHNQNITQLMTDLKSSVTSTQNYILILLAFLLVSVNIYLEGIKWKVQLKPIEDISKWKSFLSIFTGMTSGMFFPNRMGNFLGRIFMLEKGDRIKAAMVTIVGGMAQMIATVSIGLLASIFFVNKYFILILIASILIIATLLIMYFNIHLLKYFQFLIPKKFKEKTKEYFEIFSLYKKKELLMILTFSFLRYFLYTLQFVLLIWAFNIPLNYLEAMIPISLTYLLMMVIPFITITEIAVRGSVSILVFEKWLTLNNISTSYGMMVFSASSLLWIFNIAIPAVFGLFLIHRFKFFRKNES
ncbi:lysylphosphatidylglycerol synthase domain-containing protein [Methanobrevibacter sp.]|uniref:lysylphosphatidylglycerol synthase domain-containing protein n=1 Tax=Methanobrevibacter sp. TaxID=66852 RepID=UPI00388E2042